MILPVFFAHISLLQSRLIGSVAGVVIALCLLALAIAPLSKLRRRKLTILALASTVIFGLCLQYVQRSIK
jgi:hypothetical protein